MRSIHLNGPIGVLAACAALTWACSSTEAVGPASLSIVSGDGRSGLAGVAVPESLVVQVTGSDGRTFAGATVAWLVTGGGASVAPASSVSDAAGRAASAVTFGAAAGTVTVTATVAGVTPATFQLTSVAACDWREPLAITATANGLLQTADCLYPDGSYIDYYGVTTATQQAAQFDLVSSVFDPFLLVNDNGGASIAGDDDGGAGSNSLLRIILAPGSYAVGANSYSAGETGAYTLTSAPIAESFTGCLIWFLTTGVQTTQQLLATDCSSSGTYADGMTVALRAGRTYTITQNSTAFDAYLILVTSAGTVVATDDDGGGGSNARIVYTPSATGLFIIFASSWVAGETGAYTLGITASAAVGTAGSDEGLVPLLRHRGASWPGLEVVGAPRAPKLRE